MKGAARRITRVGEEIRKEISGLLRELRDPRIGLTSVTEVVMSADLRHGRVYVSVLGDKEDRLRTLEGLNRAASHIRHEIGARLRLRNIPDLNFVYDTSIERGARIEELLEKSRRLPEESDR